jgi:gliding motility associated protien GldN
MNITATLFALFLCQQIALAGDTLKQKLPTVPDNPCNPFHKENIGSRRQVPYTYLREGDVMWQKRVWREIDLREKQNQPLYYPLELNACRTSLIQALTKHVLNEEIIAFKDEHFMVPYSLNEVRSRLVKTDTIEQIGVDLEGNDLPAVKIAVADSTGIYARVLKFVLKEDWFFDRQKSTLDVRIIGIAAMEYNEERDYFRELFWVYFPACRSWFAASDVYNDKNDSERRSLDDVFWKRQFSSRIIKESNVADRSIEQYQKGIDALVQAENIRLDIARFEHDLWNY